MLFASDTDDESVVLSNDSWKDSSYNQAKSKNKDAIYYLNQTLTVR